MSTDDNHECGPIRAWFKRKATAVKIYASAVAAVLGVAIGWNQLGWDRPALHSEVTEVSDFSKGTRIIVLGQEWERLNAQIRKLEQKQHLSFSEESYLSNLYLRLREVEEQLEELKQNG